MKFFRKLYEQVFYSEYGELATTSLLVTCLFIFVYLFEIPVMATLNNIGLLNLPYVFEFASIVTIILIVSVCSRAIRTSNALRMLIYTMVFAVSVGVSFIAFSNVYWFADTISYETLTVFSSLSKFIFSLGLLVGATIPLSIKMKQKKQGVVRFIILLIWAFAAFVMLKITNNKMLLDISHISIRWYTFLEYLTAVILIVAFAIHFRSYTIEKKKFVLKFMNGIAILIIAQVVRLTFIRYTFLYHLIYSLYMFIGYYYIYHSLFEYNIVTPVNELINEEKQIKLYAENLEVIVDRRTTEMNSNNMRLIQEIEYAKSIQQSLLPARKVNFNKVIFTSEYFPCERLSGDFFDIYRLDDDNIGMYVLDVSGHGVSAALMTMFCNNYIKSSEKLIMKYRGLKPHRNLKHFYEEFNKMNFPDEMYMVMFFASYNIESGVLTYASGGINCYPLLMRKDGTKEYLDKSKGFPICKMSDFFTPTYTSETTQLKKGDRIIFYTDGLVDNVKNDTISEEVLEEVMFNYRDLSLKSLNNKIKSYIQTEDGLNEDDITYFVMEI